MKKNIFLFYFLIYNIAICKIDYRIILDRNIFSPKETKQESSVKYPEVVQKFVTPAIDKIFNIVGTVIFEEDLSKNIAIIEEIKTKNINFYKVGDVINDFKILDILENKVIFEYEGEEFSLSEIGCECLTIPEGAFVFEVKMNALLYVIGQQIQVIENLKIKKIKEGNKLVGFEINGIEDGSFLEEFGIQNMDIITEINGQLPEDTDFYIDLYESILKREIKRIEIKFLREGKKNIFIYHFIP